MALAVQRDLDTVAAGNERWLQATRGVVPRLTEALAWCRAHRRSPDNPILGIIERRIADAAT